MEEVENENTGRTLEMTYNAPFTQTTTVILCLWTTRSTLCFWNMALSHSRTPKREVSVTPRLKDLASSSTGF